MASGVQSVASLCVTLLRDGDGTLTIRAVVGSFDKALTIENIESIEELVTSIGVSCRYISLV